MNELNGERYYSISEIDAIEREKDERLQREIEKKECIKSIDNELINIQKCLESAIEVSTDKMLGAMLETPLIKIDYIRDNLYRLYDLLGVKLKEDRKESSCNEDN